MIPFVRAPAKTQLAWIGLALVFALGAPFIPSTEAGCAGMSTGRAAPEPPANLPDDNTPVTGAPAPKKPGGAVTPGLRDPADPPPPEPPPEQEPPTTPPNNGGKPLTGAKPPPQRAPSAPATGMGSGSQRGKRRAGRQDSESSWTTWWYFNRWSYLPSRNASLRRHLNRVRPTTHEGPGPLTVWDDKRDRLAREAVEPALFRLLHQELSAPDQPMKGAAALALARISNAPIAVDAVLRVAEDPSLIETARTGAVSAAGLFRRSDPKRQMSGARLDTLRTRLLALCDDTKAPLRVRCLAVMSVGMLGDQPYGDAFPAGLLVSKTIAARLTTGDPCTEMTVALLTALGLQPDKGIAEDVREQLRGVVMGRRVGGRRWNEWERSHALSTLIRFGHPSSRHLLLNVLATKRGIPASVRRAAFIGLGACADEFTPAERFQAMKSWDAGRRLARDPLTSGLASIALGRLVAADVRAKGGRLLDSARASDILQEGVRRAPTTTRGFAVIGLALAARDAGASTNRSYQRFRSDSRKLVLEGLRKSNGDGAARGAYVVAAGLLGMKEALPLLEVIVRDKNESRELRGFAAVACGQIGKPSPRTLDVLKAALRDRLSGSLRREAALALAYLEGTTGAAELRKQMARGRTQHTHILGHVALALGQMGDLDSVDILAQIMTDPEARHGARGASAVALGLICDPEEKPSLSRLWQDANYPARTAALHEALNYF